MAQTEQTPLLRPSEAGGQDAGSPTHRLVSKLVSYASTVTLLVVPLLLGLIQNVQVPAEIDAIRSLSCAHYYSMHPQLVADGSWDTTSCLIPEVEQHFSKIATGVTFTVVLANFAGMLVYGRYFTDSRRRWMAAQGLCGLALGRVPFLILPLYQFPIYTPPEVRAMSPTVMLGLFWTCAVLGGLSGTNELVTLTVESFMADTDSPDTRSFLFRAAQVATLLGSSIGPLLGSVAAWVFPNANNRCFGYHECQQNVMVGPTHLLFNNAPYWLAFIFALFGLVWVLFVLNMSRRVEGTNADASGSREASKQHARPMWGASLGAFQRLIPVRISRWSYDTRILQFTIADMCVALSKEGPIVLIYVMGFVFHWGRDQLSVGLTTFNSVRLANMLLALPIVLRVMTRFMSKPDEIARLSSKQLDACLNPNQRLASAARNEHGEIRIDDETISPDQQQVARLWRAQVDLQTSRLAFLYVLFFTHQQHQRHLVAHAIHWRHIQTRMARADRRHHAVLRQR